MLKFFRKKRKKLADENRPMKYFRYAVGEIVLVVIGILIALQINTWNQEKNNKKKEFYLLQQLQNEIKTDSIRIVSFSNLTKGKVKYGKLIKSYLEGKMSLTTDSLLSHIFFNGKMLLFESHTPTYDEMISTGNLSLLSNEEIKNQISNYKSHLKTTNSFLFFEAHEHKRKYNAHIYKYFDAEIMTHLWENRISKDERMITEEDIKNFRMDFNGFKKDLESMYHVSTIIGVDAELNYQYTHLFNPRINEILNLLRKEIKTFEK